MVLEVRTGIFCGNFRAAKEHVKRVEDASSGLYKFLQTGTLGLIINMEDFGAFEAIEFC